MAEALTSPNPAFLNRNELTILQQFLQGMGYNPGGIDGLWGPKTKAAWDQFSSRNAMTELTDDSWEQILSGSGTGWQRGDWSDAPVFEDPVVQQVAGRDNDPLGTVNDQAEEGTAPETGTNEWGLSADEEQAVREIFPSYAYLLDMPIIGDLLRKAIREGMPLPKFKAALEQTEWWKTTNENQRSWDALIHRDPATAESMLAQQEVLAANLLSSYGITINGLELKEMSIQILRDGLSPEQQLRLVGEYARKVAKGDSGGALGASFEGKLGDTVQMLQKMATQYFLQYTEDELEDMAIRIMEGRWSMEGAATQMTKQASELYPHLQQRLMEGMTVWDYFAPVKARLSQLLNMNPNDIDLTDPKWADVTNVIDDGKGNYRSMNFTELQRFARKQKEWWDTDQARAEGYGLANTLLKTMGAI